jgi:hypothetical protein
MGNLRRLDTELNEELIREHLKLKGRTNIHDTACPGFMAVVAGALSSASYYVRKPTRWGTDKLCIGYWPDIPIDIARDYARLILGTSTAEATHGLREKIEAETRRLREKIEAEAATTQQADADLASARVELESLRHKLRQSKSERMAIERKIAAIDIGDRNYPVIDHHDEAAIVEKSGVIDYKRMSGVYFLVRGARVVYVGQSVNVVARVATHLVDPKKTFERVAFLPVDDPGMLTPVEQFFIFTLDPPLNGVKPSAANEQFLRNAETARKWLDARQAARSRRSNHSQMTLWEAA